MHVESTVANKNIVAQLDACSSSNTLVESNPATCLQVVFLCGYIASGSVATSLVVDWRSEEPYYYLAS